MEKRIIFVLINYIMSVPLILIYRIFFMLNFLNVKADVDTCRSYMNINTYDIPDNFVNILIFAEDHRNSSHFGIDPIAMMRAFYRYAVNRKVEGASTIEQQYVRTVLQKHERTFTRKIREQIIATTISNKKDKKKIAKRYLSIAFYGSKYIGTSGIRTIVGSDLSLSTENDVFGVIARLKYPEPMRRNPKWVDKYERRIAHIAAEAERESRKRGQSPFSTAFPYERGQRHF